MEKRYSGRRRRRFRWLWLLMIPVLAAAGYTLWRFGPQRSYTAQQLGLTDLQSPNDADGDGVDDWTDMVLGARLSRRRTGGLHRRHLAGFSGGGL